MKLSSAKRVTLVWMVTLVVVIALATTAFGATTQGNINALVAAGKCGTVLQGMAMERCAGIMTWNRPYMGDAVKDCYGYTRQVWNAILFDGSTHPEDYTDYSYDTAYYWLAVSGGLPVNTYPDSNWATISSLGGVGNLLPGDVCGTSQGHQWGMSVHYGMYAGKNGSGSNMCYQCGGGYNGAYYTPWYSGWTWYYVPLHTALATTPPPSGEQTILDNTDAALTGSWSTGTMSTDKYGTNYNYCSAQVSDTATATWCPNFAKPGYYDVYVWYPQGTNRTTAAPYKVVYKDGSVTVPVDQTSGGGTWNKIASYLPFLSGTGGYVVLGNGTGGAGGVVMADAVMFEFVADLDVTQPTISAITRVPAVAAAGHPVQVTVIASDDVGVTSVTANGSALAHTQGSSWVGNITADAAIGTHPIAVVASDAGHNLRTNSSIPYRTAKVLSIAGRTLIQDLAVAPASGTYLFRTWGTANVTSSNTFTLTDGSYIVYVSCPSHGLATGNIVSVCGTWDAASSTISCRVDQVHKFNL